VGAEGFEASEGVEEVSGFVAASAEGFGGEVGAVGFDEEAVEWDVCGDVAEFGGFGEGEGSGEGDVEAEVEESPGVVPGSGEAVGDAAEVSGAGGGGEEGEAVVEGVAAMDDEGEVAACGEVELPFEGVALCGAGGVVIVIVESGFADGDNVAGEGEGFDLATDVGGGAVGFVGVDSDGGAEEVGMGAGECECGGAGFESCTDGDDARKSGGAGALKDGVEVGGEAGVVEVGVGVYEHGGGA